MKAKSIKGKNAEEIEAALEGSNAENEGLHDIWKAPIAGFFTYGEYGKDIEGKQKFHSTTCSWVALKEK
jgi:hypothetical protein